MLLLAARNVACSDTCHFEALIPHPPLLSRARADYSSVPAIIAGAANSRHPEFGKLPPSSRLQTMIMGT